MAKDAYYFSHDSNARNDPKIKALRKKYGSTGYGNYWIIIEYLRESDDYKLPLKQYIFEALSEEFNVSSTDVEQFLNDCITEFELFQTEEKTQKNETWFFSVSLQRRMKRRDERREKARIAGKISAQKRQESTNVEQPLNKRSTNVERSLNECQILKESKGKEKKVNIYTKEAEEIYDYYKTKIKPGCRTDAVHNISKMLQNGFKRNNLISYVDNYFQSLVKNKTDFKYYIQANNFFGKAERYKDYMDLPTDTEWKETFTLEDAEKKLSAGRR